MSLFRAMATVGSLTMASRILGFARDVAVAASLGAGPMADAFFVAFKFPNFFRRLFGEGAFNSAFVPIFAGLVATHGRLAALGFAEQALAVLVTALLVLQIVAIAAMPWLMLVLAPGFADEPAQFALAIELTRITFPYLLFICLVALMSGMLNALDRFAAAAAAPILLNLAMLVAVAGWPILGLASAAHGLAWGVFVAGVLQLIWLSVGLQRAGVVLRLPRPRLTPEVRRLLRLMGPGAIGAGVTQINLLIDIILASLLPTGSVSYLYYADRVNQLPLGILGAAIGTALLPMLSRQIRSGMTDAAANAQSRALEYALVLGVPSTIGLVLLCQPIIAVLFERGAFGPDETAATSAALAAFAIGLPAYLMVKVFATCFFAREDTTTPVKIAIVAVGFNLVLNLLLMQVLAHVGLALSTALAGYLNAGLLGLALHRRGWLSTDVRLRRRLMGLAATAVAMVAALVTAQALLGTGPLDLLALCAIGALTFAGVGQLSGAIDWADLRRSLRRAR